MLLKYADDCSDLNIENLFSLKIGNSYSSSALWCLYIPENLNY